MCGASAPHDTTKPSKQRNSPSGVHFELSPEGEHVSFVNFLPSLDAFGGSAVEAECGLVVIFLLEFNEFLHESAGDFLSARLPVEVVEFVRVFVEVEEFPRVDVAVEVDEFPTVGGADAIVALDRMFGGELIEVIVNSLAPVLGVLALQEREHGASLNVGGNLCSGEVEEGRCVVDVLYHFANLAACFESFRQTHDEGCGE